MEAQKSIIAAIIILKKDYYVLYYDNLETNFVYILQYGRFIDAIAISK